jgi:hypothetical protein
MSIAQTMRDSLAANIRQIINFTANWNNSKILPIAIGLIAYMMLTNEDFRHDPCRMSEGIKTSNNQNVINKEVASGLGIQ